MIHQNNSTTGPTRTRRSPAARVTAAVGAGTRSGHWPKLATVAKSDEKSVVVGGLSALEKRAGRKAKSYELARALVSVTKGKLMGNAYARTMHQCGQALDQCDGKLRTYYCGYRWCFVCNGIRTARAIAAYHGELESWGSDRYLVTLTVPNVSGGALRTTVREMHHAFTTTGRVLKRRFGVASVQMLRATEVTHSERRGDYHPHMHVMVRGEAVAKALRDQWLKRYPDARLAAQDVRQADKGSVMELLKYSFKLVSDKPQPDGSRGVVPAVALDTIFTALRGLRLWQPVGVRSADADAADDTAALETDAGTAATTRPNEAIVWMWQQGVTDWVDAATGECLTGYTPSRSTRVLLDKLHELVPLATGPTWNDDDSPGKL